MTTNFTAPPGVFVYRTELHFDELDPLWVLHHSRYLYHLERACQAMFDAVMETEAFDPQRYPDLYQVVRNLQIRYRESIRKPGPVLICLRVTGLRASGLSWAFEFRSGDGSILHADGTREVCKLSLESHAPEPWSELFRGRYEALREEAS